MKDITHYFTTSPKENVQKQTNKNNLSALLENKNAADSVNPNLYKKRDTLEGSDGVIIKEKKTGKKHRNKRRKLSDPVITSVTQQLCASLNIISPNTSADMKNLSKSLQETSEIDCEIVGIAKQETIKLTTDRTVNTTPRPTNLKDVPRSDGKSNNKHIKKRPAGTKNKEITDKDEPIGLNCDTTPRNVKQVRKSRSSDIKENSKEVKKSSEKSINEKPADTKNKENGTLIPNAFQFLMDSRHKVIGSNSCGKDKSLSKNEDSQDFEESRKEKQALRKNLLQGWADQKGASKRKREDEEKGEIIQKKLEKRAKRLKNMLSLSLNKTGNMEESSEEVVEAKPRKRCVVKRLISTDSEDSTSAPNEAINENEKNIKEKLVKKVVEVIDEEAQNNVICRSPKTKDNNKNTLLNFFGIVEKIGGKNIDNDKSKDHIEVLASGKKRKKSKKVQENIEDLPMRRSLRNIVQRVEESSQDYSLEERKTPRKKWKLKIKLLDTRSSEQDFDNKFKTTQELLDDKEEAKVKKKPYSSRDTDVNTTQEKILISSASENSSTFEDDTDFEPVSRKNSRKNISRVAPVFAKAAPKPKVDPEVIEARKHFLMSGMPSSLKKAIDRQQSIDQREYDVFPKISHVQQKNESESQFWNLASHLEDIKQASPLRLSEIRLYCDKITKLKENAVKFNIRNVENEKIDDIKSIIDNIKFENPNYPVYKSFRSIYQKSGKNTENPSLENTAKSPKRKSKRHSKSRKSIPKEPPVKHSSDQTQQYTLWTEKYKPSCSEDIIGNTAAVNSLKKWLELWLSFSEVINSKGKRKRSGSMSDSDFESTDGGSRDSVAKLPKNTLILSGPNGSGKTAAVYAICNELGFNVLELNASSKRTGKRLLQELQEATQSHQVRNNQLNPLNIFVQTTKSKQIDESKDTNNFQKMCVLLVEDVDIVFEQDDGFLPALSQLVSTSKRPIILTTSDENSFSVQRFINDYDSLSFLPLTAPSLAVWLQLVCLMEGRLVSKNDIGLLLEFNKGDVRKTLLELQFWVMSGGQKVLDDNLPLIDKVNNFRSITPELLNTDHDQDVVMSEGSNCEKEECFEHKNCIASFENFSDNIPKTVNLETLWWNIPNILNVQTMAHERLDRFTANKSSETVDSNVKKQRNKNSLDDKLRLNAASKLYDSLVLTDVLLRKNYHCEPSVSSKRSYLKDSLELSECLESYKPDVGFSIDLARFLIDGCINEYRDIEDFKCKLDMSVPVAAERRWRSKQLACEESFRDALPLFNCTERDSVSLDYLPLMRQIARTEEHRAANNTKRGNRFRHYFRDFRMKFCHNTCTMSCNILFNS